MSVERRLTFYAWADTNEKHPFDRLDGARTLKSLPKGKAVFDDGREGLTAVEVVSVGNENSPTKLLLHALHGPGNRPSDYGPGEGTRTIQIGNGRYTAFTGHVLIWGDKVAAIDVHANSPGLGRLAVYLRHLAEERVIFRPLFNQSMSEQLRDLEGIRGVDLAIHDPHKIVQARKRGTLRSLIPSRKFPSVRVSAGMSRKEPKDSYLEPEIETEVLELADSADQFFDRLIVRGNSKTERTPTGRPKSVRINLLSERLHIPETLPADEENPSLPKRNIAFARLAAARKSLDASGALEDAAEARLALEAE